jgi:4-hydroxy-tetrahydrodipicolinate reductase
MNIMVNGLPGRMATETAWHVLQSSDLFLHTYSLTGQRTDESTLGFNGIEVTLLRPTEQEKYRYQPDVAIDFTHPEAVYENAALYCRKNIPFVMGTTGGNYQVLEEMVAQSEISAVIAPNMAKQIVVFQSMLHHAAEHFPAVFAGYTLEIFESHPPGKADVSGTAASMLVYFNRLGIPFVKDQIRMIRKPADQRRIGVPEDALDGHAWHTYRLQSEDGSVLFEFVHNINGRGIYAEGALAAARFLGKKMQQEEKGKIYSMMDVVGCVLQK